MRIYYSGKVTKAIFLPQEPHNCRGQYVSRWIDDRELDVGSQWTCDDCDSVWELTKNPKGIRLRPLEEPVWARATFNVKKRTKGKK